MPATLLDRLLELYPSAKRTTLRRMIDAGRVTIDGKKARTLKQPLTEQAVVKVMASPSHSSASAAQPQRPSQLPFKIIHEDEDLLVIDKPAGLLTSTVPREKRTTALALVRDYVKSTSPRAQLGLIHRLDRDASGLLVFSKTHEAYLSLKRQFFEHSVDRVYLALVEGKPNPLKGTIDSLLVERADGTVRPTEDPRRAERAITHYETIESKEGRSLVRVKLQTGKKHQIRVQLAMRRGTPIVNDPVYGKNKPQGRLMLSAAELGFIHPRTGKRVLFKIDPSPEFSVESKQAVKP